MEMVFNFCAGKFYLYDNNFNMCASGTYYEMVELKNKLKADKAEIVMDGLTHDEVINEPDTEFYIDPYVVR